MKPIAPTFPGLDQPLSIFGADQLADAIAERVVERMAAQRPMLITAKEAAEILRCSPRTVQQRANRGEQMNRDLYDEHHKTIFGEARIARLKAVARTIRKYTTAELLELRAALKAELEKP